METRYKILLVDDDQTLLDVYCELLKQLPSKPEIATTTSGTRAITMMESEQYRLLICDLKMPKVDGLQVLSIVRRRFPQVRTVALTSVVDEQFRSRVYALGVDLFWHKPATERETQMFMECLESLLGQETESGFRGVQSKSLVDIIQMECLSQSSSVLRIANGQLSGKVWIQDGELIDAEAGELHGEKAFHKILAWKNGTFETLPAEPSRPRKIVKPYNGLLLETAQALDEQAAAAAASQSKPQGSATPLTKAAQMDGVEFLLALDAGTATPRESKGLENPESMAAWARQTIDRFRGLGELLHAGPMGQISGMGQQRNVALASKGKTEFCVGWRHSLSSGQIRELMKKVLALWA